jgi:hypothetical protein
LKRKLRGRDNSSPITLPATLESLESRRLCYATIPSGYTELETVQIRPASATYTSDMTLVKGTTYFLRATGYTKTAAGAFDTDADHAASTSTSTSTTTTTTTTTATGGITTVVGSTTVAATGWGSTQTDHIYGQSITPTATGALSFTFADGGTDKTSTLAVTVYSVVPAIKVATIRTDVVIGSTKVSALPNQTVYLPLDDADWDQNGVADDKQSGAVQGDQFLLPVTLPAIATATTTSHILIEAPSGVRVWLNADRTGSTVGVGLRATKARTVYLEGTAEQLDDAAATLRVLLPVAGISMEEDVPVTVFGLAGPTTATGGSKQVFSSDSSIGKWSSAVGGTLDTADISIVHKVAYADVVWNDAAGVGYADFDVDADYLWGWPVEITA